MRRRRAPVFPIGRIFATLLVIALIAGGAFWLITRVIIPNVQELTANLGANMTVVPFHEHFSLDPSVTQIVLDGQRLRGTEPPLVVSRGATLEPHVFLRASFLREHIDPFVFWDAGAQSLFISTLYEMLEFTPASTQFFINGSPRILDMPIRYEDGDVFVSICIIQGLYPLIIEYQSAYNMVVITTANIPQTTATIAVPRSHVRYWPDERSSPITAQLEYGDELTVFIGFDGETYQSSNESQSDFVRVRTADGLLGYVLIANLDNVTTATPWDTVSRDMFLPNYINNTVHPPRVWTGTGPINVAWDAVEVLAGNNTLMQTPLDPSITAVAPKWFRIDDAGTHINSIASRAYVDWAHSHGVQVWPMVFDVGQNQSRLMLTNRRHRQHVINQIVQYVDTLNLDGINIDFEHLTAAEGPYKIQFLRELNIPLRQRGVVLSAAVKVPLPATAFYRRDLIALTADFVMVMAYDQYWATSPTAGPNASLPWVRTGVNNMLREVPHYRLILGIPFYNRVWRENPITGAVNHHGAWNTAVTREFFENNNVEWVWDANLASYFGEVVTLEGGETVRTFVWLEDARSIQEKLHLFTDNNLGGIAVWSRGLAIPEFWEVIAPYF